MLNAHTASFLKLIDTVLEDTARGVVSRHHLHNVRCGIENIVALLECNDELVDKADQLSRRACDYITCCELITSKISDGKISDGKISDGKSGEDDNRLRIAREALDSFRSAAERSQPNSRVRTLGLA